MRISDWSSDVCSSDLQALWCPTTRRVLDVGFRGLSPYDRGRIHPRATPILMPRLAFPNGRAASGRRVDDVEIDRHLAEDPATCILRRAGMWGDQQDRAVRAAPWLRAAEHSAQPPAYVLRRYENLFKAGEINVLRRSEQRSVWQESVRTCRSRESM